MRRMFFRLLGGGAAGLVLLTAAAGAEAKSRSSSSSTTGYDISYPQCGSTYPSGAAFGIVGVNGGLANDANACLASELAWAQATPGLSSPPQAAVSLYINTADPGPGVADWPASSVTPTPYNTCNGTWTTACAYIYGEDRASYSYGLVSSISSLAATASWWLDIETGNSWATSTTVGYTDLNIATIQGFIAGLQAAGATGPVGVYSTASQWSTITGLDATTTSAWFTSPLNDWVAGARALRGAQGNCTTGGFTGALPTLAQYSSGGVDSDLRCG